MTRRLMLILTACLLMLTAFCARAEDKLSVTCPKGDLKVWRNADFTVNAPFAGELTVTVSDTVNTWRTVTQKVHDGKNTFTWDVSGENRQALKNGRYRMRFRLAGSDGAEAETETEVTVRGKQLTMRYALPSSGTLYTDGGERWFIEYSLSGQGTVAMDVSRNGELLGTVTGRAANDGCHLLYWDGKIKGTRADPGEYQISCYCTADPGYRAGYTVSIRGTAPAVPAVQPTGPIMAERGMTDDEVWEKMMMPSVVSTEGMLGHQEVYAAASEDAESLGTLHGQTQAVEVLRVTDTGWALIRAWEHEDGAAVTGYVPAGKLTVVYPNDMYGLLVDKREQTATLYERGKAIASFPVSTGKVAPNKLIRETAAGSFLTNLHERSFTSEGYDYDYPLRYDGGNMMHQTGYKTQKGIRRFDDQMTELGRKASHGCIRLPAFPTGDSTVTACWLWSHLPYHTRIMILDDSEEREAEAVTLAGSYVTDKYSSDVLIERSEGPEEAYVPGENDTKIVITAGGDAVLGTRRIWWNDENAFNAYIARNGTAYPFSGLQEFFSTDDMTFINLECVLKDSNEDERTRKQYRFRGPTRYTQILLDGSVEQVNLANNHYIDYVDAGKLSTRKALQKAGIPYSGYSHLYVMEKDGHKIGFAGIREHIWKQKPKTVANEIKKLRGMGCEVVIYSCHWGTEYDPMHNDLQMEIALSCARAGADIVIGNHPHVVQGVGNIDDTVILWSLGNLSFGGSIEMQTFDAALARLELIFDEQGYRGVNVTMVPILTSSSAAEGINDYRPVPAEGEDRARIMEKIRQDSSYDVDGTLFFRHER